MQDKPKSPSLMQYAGFAVQLAAGLLLAVFAGKWIDTRAGISIPLLIWLLPLLLLVVMLVKVVRDTSKK